jgi:hypothetical protein
MRYNNKFPYMMPREGEDPMGAVRYYEGAIGMIDERKSGQTTDYYKQPENMPSAMNQYQNMIGKNIQDQQ